MTSIKDYFMNTTIAHYREDLAGLEALKQGEQLSAPERMELLIRYGNDHIDAMIQRCQVKMNHLMTNTMVFDVDTIGPALAYVISELAKEEHTYVKIPVQAITRQERYGHYNRIPVTYQTALIVPADKGEKEFQNLGSNEFSELLLQSGVPVLAFSTDKIEKTHLSQEHKKVGFSYGDFEEILEPFVESLTDRNIENGENPLDTEETLAFAKTYVDQVQKASKAKAKGSWITNNTATGQPQ